MSLLDNVAPDKIGDLYDKMIVEYDLIIMELMKAIITKDSNGRSMIHNEETFNKMRIECEKLEMIGIALDTINMHYVKQLGNENGRDTSE